MIRNILKAEKVAEASLSVTFVTHQKIRALNLKYLNRSYATDVLAFDLTDDGPLTGDIFISTDAAITYGRKHDVDVKRELILYVIHGVLHLLGYDDHSPEDTRKMRRAEESYLKLVQRSIPKAVLN